MEIEMEMEMEMDGSNGPWRDGQSEHHLQVNKINLGAETKQIADRQIGILLRITHAAAPIIILSIAKG